MNELSLHLDNQFLLLLEVILAFDLRLEFGTRVVLEPFRVPHHLRACSSVQKLGEHLLQQA